MNTFLETPTAITLGITETCPLQCRHCYADCARAPKPGELDAATWTAMVEGLARGGIVQTYVEGGEPLAKPGILDILRAAARSTMTLLRTHGAGLDEAMSWSLAEIGVGRVLVDLMGGRAETHDAQAGVAGAFAQSCAAVRHLVARGIPTDVLVILTRETAPELQRIAELAADLGAARLGVLRLYPLGRAKRAWSALGLPLAEQMQALAALRLPRGLGLMQSWHPKNRNCCWQGAAINAFGRAIGCMYLREYVDFGDATSTPYEEIWRTHPLYRQLRAGDVEQSCPECTHSEGSRGGCRSTAFAWHQRWTAPDPYDTTLNGDIDLSKLPSHVLGA